MTTKAPKPTPPLTELQRHVLDYLHVFLALNDCLPPAAHIAREFGWSSASNASETASWRSRLRQQLCNLLDE